MTFVIWSFIVLTILVMTVNIIIILNHQVFTVASFYGD